MLTLIFAKIFKKGMQSNRSNTIFSVVFTIFSLLFLGSFVSAQQHDHGHSTTPAQEAVGHEAEAHNGGDHKEGTHQAAAEPKKFNAAEVIFGHVLDGHEYHFMDIGDHPVTLPLPIILYCPTRDTWDVFMSSRFEHGHAAHKGYLLLNEHSIHEMGLDTITGKKFSAGDIVPVDADGHYDAALNFVF